MKHIHSLLSCYIFLTVIIVSICEGSLSAQNVDSAISSPSVSDTLSGKNRIIYSLTVAAHIRPMEPFVDEIPQKYSLFKFDPGLQSCLYLDGNLSIPVKIKSKYRRFLAGAGYEKFNYEIDGILDSEFSASGILFQYYEFGDLVKIDHDISIYSLLFGYEIMPYRGRKFVGLSFKGFISPRYYRIKEEVDIEMQSGFQIVAGPDGDMVTYKSDYFSRHYTTHALTMLVGLRAEMYLGKHFSLILPQINYEFGISEEEPTGETYEGRDHDLLVVKPRKHDINDFSFMLGAALHF